MLERKFPKKYQTRADTKQLHTKIARHWVEYTRQDTKNTVDSIFGQIDLPDAESYDRALETETDQRKWSVGTFALDEFDAFGVGGRDLGFVPAAYEEVLERERESALEFLRIEGLDPSVVDRTSRLHAKVFKGLASMDGSSLHLPREWPSGMLFDPPKMILT